MKRHLLPESFDKSKHSLKKQRHHFADYKALTNIVKAVVFPVVLYRCESWTTKKAEGRRIDALELWC